MSKDIRHFVLETLDFGKFDVVEYKEYQKLENIIKEVREYIKYNATSNYFDREKNMFRREIDLLEILDKGE